jgi:inner membrane protein
VILFHASGQISDRSSAWSWTGTPAEGTKMHRRGHRGITLLAGAPIVYGGLSLDLPLLTLCSVLGIAAIEPLPDCDLWVPGLRHRGVSHSVLTALGVGAILGVSGWILGGYATDILLAVPTWSAAVLELVAGGETTLLPAILSETIHASTQAIERHVHAIATQKTINRHAIALVGGAIGVAGILVHLLGDIITTRGIQPLLPLSHRRVALSPLRAKNPTVNEGLFVGGGLAMCLALSLAIPSIEVMVS